MSDSPSDIGVNPTSRTSLTPSDVATYICSTSLSNVRTYVAYVAMSRCVLPSAEVVHDPPLISEYGGTQARLGGEQRTHLFQGPTATTTVPHYSISALSAPRYGQLASMTQVPSRRPNSDLSFPQSES